MRNATFFRKMLWLLCIPLLTFSCEDKMDEHYEIPKWVAGNAWEVLSSGEHGNYSTFLEGVEIAGYKQMLQGKSILTVMAPEDDAFQTYLKDKGYATIHDMPVNEVKKVIGYHVLYYSYNKEELVNFRPTGSMETDEEKNVEAGLYYKHRTKSADVPAYETTAGGSPVMVYHLERFVPVFSYRFFQTKKIDAKKNYEAFYPNSTWTGDNGFNVSNASVKEYGVIANNGYIHIIDRVLEPLETIYTELKERNEYSVFFDLYDSFGAYVADKDLTKSYAAAYGVDTLYQYQHEGLPNIACEWPVNSYMDFTALTSKAYSIFAPSNNAINKFFNEFWKVGGYETLAEVDKLAQNSFLRQFIYGGSLVFPDEVGAGKLESAEGSFINIDPASLKDKIMCINGALYGMDQIQKPSTFNSVIGPAFQYKEARSFLYALQGSNMLSAYTSEDANYIVLIPTATQFENSGIRTSYSTQTLEEETAEEGWKEIGDGTKTNIMQIHTANIATNQKAELPKSGRKVIPALSTWNYWFVKDGTITCNAQFNQQLNPEFSGNVFAPFTETAQGSNGKAYSFDNSQIFDLESNSLSSAIAICADRNYVYYNFAQLMKKADMVANGMLTNLIGKGRFAAFIPTNEAIQQALLEERIPGATHASFDAQGNLTGDFNPALLKNYLNSYFLTSSHNSIHDYPYVGSAFTSGKYMSENSWETEEGTPAYTPLTYTDNGSTLSIQLDGHRSCNVISDYDYFPFAFNDGCFHLIDDAF